MPTLWIPLMRSTLAAGVTVPPLCKCLLTTAPPRCLMWLLLPGARGTPPHGDISSVCGDPGASAGPCTGL